MSYLEQLKKLNMATIATAITDTRPSGSCVSRYSEHIPENQFLADSQIKLNQARCSNCINLYQCSSARNIKGQCPSDFTKRKH